jgi:hypothetical protein
MIFEQAETLARAPQSFWDIFFFQPSEGVTQVRASSPLPACVWWSTVNDGDRQNQENSWCFKMKIKHILSE